jgi:hypothetical protein
MTEFILKGEQDADDFFSQNPRISKNLLEWVHPSPVRKYKFFYFFVPSVFLLFFLLRKKKN